MIPKPVISPVPRGPLAHQWRFADVSTTADVTTVNDNGRVSYRITRRIWDRRNGRFIFPD